MAQWRGLSQHRLTGDDLRLLKWIAVAGPLLFVAALYLVHLQLLAARAQPLVALAIPLLLLGAGSWLFARWVFGLVTGLQRRLEEALAAAEKGRTRLLAMLDASADGIYVVDADERITLANRTLEQLLDLPREQIIGQTCFGHTVGRISDGRRLCEIACPFQESVRHRYPIEINLPTTAGPRPMEVSSGRILNDAGEVEAVVHVLRDLTARKEVEHLQDEFISLVSHELKTPLNHIKGFASTLLQDDVEWDPESERDFLQTIDQEADRLTHLVDNILEMARLANVEQGIHLRLDWHAPGDIITAVAERQRAFAPTHQFVVDLRGEMPPIRCDRRTIELLLTNLLDNAVKYSPPSTTVTVEAWTEGPLFKVAVRDQGEGIPAGAHSQIFERFYRGTTPLRTPGTGLGLAICRRVAEAHGGTLSVESARGSGSTFTLALPFGGVADDENTYPRG
jgi:PAS domain S-box-containing protein